MYHKRKRIRKIKIIGVTLLALILILVSIVFIKEDRNLNILERYTKDGLLFISNIVTYPINYIKNKAVDTKEKKEIYNKAKELQVKADSYDALLAEKQELEKEIAELKKVVELNDLLGDKKVMNAVVVNRNLSYWYDTININKGSKDGIEEGMPVVVNEGLIGKVINVSNFNSTVRLLTSPSNHKISVKIKNGEEYVYGLLSSYDEENNLYKIEGISQTININLDSLVTTTGLGDIFPSGIVVGKVVGTTSDSYDLSRIIEVEPSVNFNHFSVVTVIKRNISE